MIFQTYTAVLRRISNDSHYYNLARQSLKTLACKHTDILSSLKKTGLPCGGRLVPRICRVCMHYHKEAGSHSGQDAVEVETNYRDGLLYEDNNEMLTKKVVRKKRSKNSKNNDLHIPVLKEEVLNYLGGKPGQKLLDMTFGAGGHTKALLDSAPGCHVFALDRDPLAHKLASELAEDRPGQITPLLGRFSELPTLLAARGIQPDSLDGVLFDFGCSSMQFDQSERGFMLSKDGPLDMRMDADRLPDQPTAADVVNTLDEVDLAKIFKKYGEERRAMKIAHAIVETRSAFGRITRTKELADIVESACEGSLGTDSLGRYSHPATKIFQALRIFVNNELNELNSGLDVVHQYLKPGGICVAISFHSLEDRIVKRHFNTIDMDEEHCSSITDKIRMRNIATVYSIDELESMVIKKWEPLFKKVRQATDKETVENPRSRSAKLRAAKKLELRQ